MELQMDVIFVTTSNPSSFKKKLARKSFKANKFELLFLPDKKNVRKLKPLSQAKCHFCSTPSRLTRKNKPWSEISFAILIHFMWEKKWLALIFKSNESAAFCVSSYQRCVLFFCFRLNHRGAIPTNQSVSSFAKSHRDETRGVTVVRKMWGLSSHIPCRTVTSSTSIMFHGTTSSNSSKSKCRLFFHRARHASWFF